MLVPGSLSYKNTNSSVFLTKSTWQALKNGNEPRELPYPAYTCDVPVNKTPGSRTCNAICCSKGEVWVSVYSYEYATSRNALNKPTATAFMPARILVYDLAGVFKKQITFDSVGATVGGIFTSIYLSPNDNAWVSHSAGKGFAVRIRGCWTLLNNSKLPTVFPSGAIVNSNAIWGNKAGQVFIGTNMGLIVYNGTGKIDDSTSYSHYTVGTSNLSSDNILGGISENDTTQWIATDNGIMRMMSTNHFSINPDYTSCHNKDINDIESQSKKDLTKRDDFHSYSIETIICDQGGPFAGNCNAQHVYDLMKSDPSFQIPSPVMFPQDNPTTMMLIGLLPEEKTQIVKNINAWKVSGIGNEFGGIKYIRQILSGWMILKYYGSPTRDGHIPFDRSLLNPSTVEAAAALQEQENPKGPVQSCKTYKIYHSPNFIADQFIYRMVFDTRFCNAKLKSVKYNPVMAFADDKNLTITNYTQEGHILHPGKITRYVTEECGKVKVVTVGVGLNYCAEAQPPSGLTEDQKKVYLRKVMMLGKMNGNGNVVVGCILFKNIDIKLKQAFDSGK
ncbi:MAG: hypothetical protein ABI315_12440 [Bacteroidia bacterium]